MKSIKKLGITGLTLCAMIFLFSAGASAGDSQEAVAEEAAVDPEVVKQIHLLTGSIEKDKEALAQYERDIKKASLESEISRLTEERKRLETKIKEQSYNLEQIATGAVDLDLFREALPSEGFSLQAELEDVLKPLFSELKKITERPRQIEQLRNTRQILNTRLEAAKVAVTEIQSLLSVITSGREKNSLSTLLSKWQTRQEELTNEVQLVDFQLDEKLNNGESRSALFANAIKNFFTGRGLNLLLAISAFILTFVSLRYFSHWLEKRISRGRDRERRIAARLVHVIFQALTTVFALLALMGTLYAASDWLILTLLIIMFIGVAFALRHSLPRYLNEVRLLLNIGPVREGERVIYNGLPWKVSRLNIHSDLVNPLLTGGRLRLPMRDVLPLVSRRWSKNEPWFPCKPNDYIILSDNTYGCVKLQTPEYVQLGVLGGSEKTYRTLDFIANTPLNLSTGFGLFISFGLDYNLQQQITDEVLSQLNNSLTKSLKQHEFGQYLEALEIDFDEAASSSLNILIIAMFSGEGAAYYNNIKRFLRGATVRACNEHNWNIPFNQITVHMQREPRQD